MSLLVWQFRVGYNARGCLDILKTEILKYFIEDCATTDLCANRSTTHDYSLNSLFLRNTISLYHILYIYTSHS